MNRTDVPYIVSSVIDYRPVRWAQAAQVLGDYDGRERTLEIFNAEPKEQLLLLAALRPLRRELKDAAGGAIVFVFHTKQETARLYADFIRDFPRPPFHLTT